MHSDLDKYKGKIFNEFVEKAHKEFIPLFSTIELTQSCNFSCQHCYNFDRTTKSKPDFDASENLSREEVFKSIKELSELGALFLNFTGGEVLLDKNIFDYVRYARDRNILPRLKTNGVLLSDDIARELFTNGVDSIDVSLYGADEETYKEFTGKADFKNTIEGVRSARRNNIEVYLNIILHKKNYKDLDFMMKLASDLGAIVQVSDEMTDRYDETTGARDLELGSSEYQELLRGNNSHFFKHHNPDHALQCSCARTVFAVGANGDVYPCIGAPIKSGSIREESLSNIWKNSKEFEMLRNIKQDNFKECKTCEYIEFCNRSSGSIYINTGDYFGCEPSVLEKAKLRSKCK